MYIRRKFTNTAVFIGVGLAVLGGAAGVAAAQQHDDTGARVAEERKPDAGVKDVRKFARTDSSSAKEDKPDCIKVAHSDDGGVEVTKCEPGEENGPWEPVKPAR
ncbi:hypothetical protein [Streptomyces sp. KR80]|uniref:hypothetical protein n=1 Tax=Streptomyces sp. KR80 TaxID=3457426 RepID=UPI003FD6B982